MTTHDIQRFVVIRKPRSHSITVQTQTYNLNSITNNNSAINFGDDESGILKKTAL